MPNLKVVARKPKAASNPQKVSRQTQMEVDKLQEVAGKPLTVVKEL